MKDDEQYQKVMGAYKVARRNPKYRAKAQKLLKEAMRLAKEGEVSPQVIEGMRYV
jgi:formiminotetrahydrofolate cyclodeaminase